MSRMDPAHVLVDASALAALADPAHEHHHQTVRAFDDLLERYRREEVHLAEYRAFRRQRLKQRESKPVENRTSGRAW